MGLDCEKVCAGAGAAGGVMVMVVMMMEMEVTEMTLEVNEDVAVK